MIGLARLSCRSGIGRSGASRSGAVLTGEDRLQPRIEDGGTVFSSPWKLEDASDRRTLYTSELNPAWTESEPS